MVNFGITWAWRTHTTHTSELQNSEDCHEIGLQCPRNLGVDISNMAFMFVISMLNNALLNDCIPDEDGKEHLRGTTWNLGKRNSLPNIYGHGGAEKICYSVYALKVSTYLHKY